MKVTKQTKIQINAAHPHSVASYGVLANVLSRTLLSNGFEYIVASSLMGGNKPEFFTNGTQHFHVYPQRQMPNIGVAGSSSNDMVYRLEQSHLMISIMNPRLLDVATYSKRNSIMWTPSETDEMMPSDIKVLEHASAIWGMSKFVTESIKRAMPHKDNIYYVPCMIYDDYVPKNKQVARDYLAHHSMRALLVNNPMQSANDPRYRPTYNELKDAFILGFNGANTQDPSRKDFYSLVEIFALILKQVPNAYLYLHTASLYGEAWWLLAKDLGVDHRILCPVMEMYDMNYFEPEDLAIIYSAWDVSLDVEYGAGFGLPPVEAMACGVPFIGLEHTSLTEHTHPHLLIKSKPKYWRVAPKHEGKKWASAWDIDVIARACIDYVKSKQQFKDNMREWAINYAQQYYPQNVYDNYIAPFFAEFDFPYEHDTFLDLAEWRNSWRKKANH